MDETNIHLTQTGYEDLENELERLKGERPAIVEELNHMRGLGDLKENSAYEVQKSKLSFLDGRIQEIEEILKNAEIIEKSSDGTVGIGNTVRLHLEGDEVTYLVVNENEADIENGKISATSPIGSALINKGVGEFIAVETPGGKITYEILHID